MFCIRRDQVLNTTTHYLGQSKQEIHAWKLFTAEVLIDCAQRAIEFNRKPFPRLLFLIQKQPDFFSVKRHTRYMLPCFVYIDNIKDALKIHKCNVRLYA